MFCNVYAMEMNKPSSGNEAYELYLNTDIRQTVYDPLTVMRNPLLLIDAMISTFHS